MSEHQQPPRPECEPSDRRSPPVWRSEELFRGHDEVFIEHGDERYRLRVTRQGKLILHK